MTPLSKRLAIFLIKLFFRLVSSSSSVTGINRFILVVSGTSIMPTLVPGTVDNMLIDLTSFTAFHKAKTRGHSCQPFGWSTIYHSIPAVVFSIGGNLGVFINVMKSFIIAVDAARSANLIVSDELNPISSSPACRRSIVAAQ